MENLGSGSQHCDLGVAAEHRESLVRDQRDIVKVWFGIIGYQALRRSDVASVFKLNLRIRAFVTGWNDRCHPIGWTETNAEVLKTANRSTTSKTSH